MPRTCGTKIHVALQDSVIDKMLANLFVVYAPGLGGNHLANILSLSNGYVSICNPSDYDNKLDGTTHFGEPKNIEFDKFKNLASTLQHQSNVFCGHVYQYDRVCREDLLTTYFANRKYLVIQFPQIGSRTYQRMLSWNLGISLKQTANLRPSAVSDLAFLYDPQVMRSILGEGKDIEFHKIDTDLLFNDDINLLLDNLTKKEIEISINRDLAQDLHTKWLNHLTKIGHI